MLLPFLPGYLAGHIHRHFHIAVGQGGGPILNFQQLTARTIPPGLTVPHQKRFLEALQMAAMFHLGFLMSSSKTYIHNCLCDKYKTQIDICQYKKLI